MAVILYYNIVQKAKAGPDDGSKHETGQAFGDPYCLIGLMFGICFCVLFNTNSLYLPNSSINTAWSEINF